MEPHVAIGDIKYDNSGIRLPSKGLYQITYGVAVEESNTGAARFQLTLNNANGRSGPVPGSALSVTPNRQLASMSVLVAAQDDDSYLHIHNISKDSSNGHAPVILNANGGVNSFINVIKLQ